MATLMTDEPDKVTSVADGLDELKVLFDRAAQRHGLRVPAGLSISLDDAPRPTLRGALGVLFDAFDDVWRIWWGEHFMRWWRAR